MTSPVGTPGETAQVADFGANPGALDMFVYHPQTIGANAPVVLVLHGCTQQALDMVNAGWNDLADQAGFWVVYAGQTTDNNPVSCFNWAGEYGDDANLVRGQGENESLKEMVDYMIANEGADASRIYVSGFSAGAAFAAVMLATWPDVFAGGAIQSGVPYRCATTVQGAYDCQNLGIHPERKKSPSEWGDLVRAADPSFAGAYPKVSIWHGSIDYIVHFENHAELIEQWTDVHGIDTAPDEEMEIAGHTRYVHHAGGVPVIETWFIDSMSHAVPVGDDGNFACGPSGFAQYFSDIGLCSSWYIADFFGLLATSSADQTPPQVDVLTPGTGDTLSGTVQISVEASDDVALDEVVVLAGETPLGVVTQPPFQLAWDTTTAFDGTYTLRATARDTSGNTSSDEDTIVKVANGNDAGPRIPIAGCQCAMGPPRPGRTPKTPPIEWVGLTVLLWLGARRRHSHVAS